MLELTLGQTATKACKVTKLTTQQQQVLLNSFQLDVWTYFPKCPSVLAARV